MYKITDQERQDLENRFTYHSPKGTQPDRYVMLRASGLELATQICEQTPRSAEQTLALRKLEECLFWANAAIARNE